MAVKYHINEVDIYKFINDTFNNNSSLGKITFSIGYYFLDDEDGNNGGFIKRFTQNGGRFDVKKSFDDDTYAISDDSFIPVGIYNLNANYLAHDQIKEITYEPTVEFLVYVENDVTFRVIELVIQEIRAKLVQYETTLDVEFLNLEGGANTTETLKVITMSGEINYGELATIQGRRYLRMSMPLTMEVTNYGEYANQERIYLSVPSVLSGAFVEMYPISWNYGVGIDTAGAQTLNDKTLVKLSRAKQIRHIPKTTAFGFSMAIQIDFNNPISKKIFTDSRNPTQETSTEIWTLKSTFSKYNSTAGDFVIDTSLTINEDFILDKKAPIEELSKGEKLVWALTFIPTWAVDS